MTVKLNDRAYQHAKRLIEEGKFVDDEREAWSDHHPSTQTENQFIEKNGFFEYGKWFLAENNKYPKDSKRYYELPYGDFENVHRCAIVAAQSRAGQDKNLDVKETMEDLLSVIKDHAKKAQ